MRRPLFWERFNARLVPDPESGCVLWTVRLNRAGYGVIRMDGREQQVHRVTWELEVGPVPDGMELDHVLARGCVHRNCANVAHLEPVTHRENLLRSPVTVAALHAAQTHCIHGHPFDVANTHWRKAGGRACLACERDRKQRGTSRADGAGWGGGT